MADNTILNTGTGGDTIRDLARGAGTVKTQVVQLDLGGATANAEVLITAGQQVMTASVPVVIASNQTAISVASTDLTATGSLSGIGSVALPTLNGADGASVQITGTWVGTVLFEGSVDGTNFFAVSGVPFISSTVVTSTTATGSWQFNVSGLQLFRARCSVFTSGAIVISIRSTSGSTITAMAAYCNGVTTVNTASTGNPVSTGGTAIVAVNPTKATNGQRTAFATDSIGRLIVVHNHERGLAVTKATQVQVSTATAPIAISLAGAAGVFYDITSLTATNSGSGPAGASFTLYECLAANAASIGTSGIVKGYYNMPASGGITIPFVTPKAMTTAGNTWYVVSPSPGALAATGTSATNIMNFTLEYVQNT